MSRYVSYAARASPDARGRGRAARVRARSGRLHTRSRYYRGGETRERVYMVESAGRERTLSLLAPPTAALGRVERCDRQYVCCWRAGCSLLLKVSTKGVLPFQKVISRSTRATAGQISSIRSLVDTHGQAWKRRPGAEPTDRRPFCITADPSRLRVMRRGTIM